MVYKMQGTRSVLAIDMINKTTHEQYLLIFGIKTDRKSENSGKKIKTLLYVGAQKINCIGIKV